MTSVGGRGACATEYVWFGSRVRIWVGMSKLCLRVLRIVCLCDVNCVFCASAYMYALCNVFMLHLKSARMSIHTSIRNVRAVLEVCLCEHL